MAMTLKLFAQAVLKAPKFIAEAILGFATLVFSESDFFSLAVASVALGFAVNPWAGVALFFGTYVVLRSVDSIAGQVHEIAQAGHHIGRGLHETHRVRQVP